MALLVSYFLPFVSLLALANSVLTPSPSHHVPTSQSPNLTTSEPTHFHSHGARRVTLKYGPYTAPASTANNGMQSYGSADVPKPCSDCLITFMQASLEWPDGTVANANNGLWLHHVVLLNMNRTAAICESKWVYEPFFASGNERGAVSVTANGTIKTGYLLSATDKIYLLLELMNSHPTPSTATVTVTYEYLPSHPAFSHATPFWLDVGGCGASEVAVPTDAALSTFNYTSSWTSDFAGTITSMRSHVHDGGTELVVARSGVVVCDARARYGESPGYVEEMDMGDGMVMEMEHVSSLEACEHVGRIEVGEAWTIRAEYDATKHELMMGRDGMPEPVMGIALGYAVKDGQM